MATLLGDFSGKSFLQIYRDDFYGTDPLGDLAGARLLLAYYEGDGYNGDAFVLYEQDGQLFEVDASHCSCNGLSWDAERTTADALVYRMEKGQLGVNWDGKTNTFRRELLLALADFLHHPLTPET